jgi:DNA-binding MarR family transcriptional regulator
VTELEKMKKGPSRRSPNAGRAQDDTLLDDIETAWQIQRPDLDLAAACTLLRMERANHLHEARLQAISKRLGLQTGELYVLLALRRAGKPYELRPTDLFRALLVTSGAMTKRVARLQDGGFILRVSANDDGRSELVRLTTKGVTAADRGIAEIAKGVAWVTAESGLTRQELAMFDRCLRKLLSVRGGAASAAAATGVAKRRASRG